MPPAAPRALSKIEFARKLQQLLLDRSWNQSDLARAAFGETEDARGYKVPKNRETISKLMRGETLPTPLTLSKLARALGMKPEELLPNAVQMAIKDEAKPEMEFKIAAGHSDVGWLQINRLVTTDTFVKIASLLQSDKAGR